MVEANTKPTTPPPFPLQHEQNPYPQLEKALQRLHLTAWLDDFGYTVGLFLDRRSSEVLQRVGFRMDILLASSVPWTRGDSLVAALSRLETYLVARESLEGVVNLRTGSDLGVLEALYGGVLETDLNHLTPNLRRLLATREYELLKELMTQCSSPGATL